MTPLDIALHDEAARFAAREELGRREEESLHERHTAAAREKHRTLEERCGCPTCGVVQVVLRSALASRGVSAADTRRVEVRGFDFGCAAYPYIATVEVDGRQVYRIHAMLNEVLAEDVLHDIEQALGRGA